MAPPLGMVSAGKPRVSVHEGIKTPQYILKRFAGTAAFPALPSNPAAPLHLNPLAPPMGRSYCFAKSRNIWATARFVKWVATGFFYDDEIDPKSVYRTIASRQTSPGIPRHKLMAPGRQAGQYEERQLPVLYPTLNP